MIDALIKSGTSSSIYMYGGLAVVAVVAAGLVFFFRRRAKLQPKQRASLETSAPQMQPPSTVNMEGLALQDNLNEPEESNTPAEDKPTEDAEEKAGVDLASIFRVATESSSSDDPSGEGSGSPDGNASKAEPDNKDQKQEIERDAMLNLFASKVEDESNVGKLAGALDDVDVRDIVGEAQSLINTLKSNRLRGKK